MSGYNSRNNSSYKGGRDYRQQQQQQQPYCSIPSYQGPPPLYPVPQYQVQQPFSPDPQYTVHPPLFYQNTQYPVLPQFYHPSQPVGPFGGHPAYQVFQIFPGVPHPTLLQPQVQAIQAESIRREQEAKREKEQKLKEAKKRYDDRIAKIKEQEELEEEHHKKAMQLLREKAIGEEERYTNKIDEIDAEYEQALNQHTMVYPAYPAQEQSLQLYHEPSILPTTTNTTTRKQRKKLKQVSKKVHGKEKVEEVSSDNQDNPIKLMQQTKKKLYESQKDVRIDEEKIAEIIQRINQDLTYTHYTSTKEKKDFSVYLVDLIELISNIQYCNPRKERLEFICKMFNHNQWVSSAISVFDSFLVEENHTGQYTTAIYTIPYCIAFISQQQSIDKARVSLLRIQSLELLDTVLLRWLYKRKDLELLIKGLSDEGKYCPEDLCNRVTTLLKKVIEKESLCFRNDFKAITLDKMYIQNLVSPLQAICSIIKSKYYTNIKQETELFLTLVIQPYIFQALERNVQEVCKSKTQNPHKFILVKEMLQLILEKIQVQEEVKQLIQHFLKNITSLIDEIRTQSETTTDATSIPLRDTLDDEESESDNDHSNVPEEMTTIGNIDDTHE